MHRRLVVLSTVSLTAAALGACADPGSPPALDAAADVPLRLVTVTVEARRLPMADVPVFTSTADGRFIAEGVTDAQGKVTLMGGATATALALDTRTAPIGDDGAVRLELTKIDPPVPPSTWAIEIATPPPPNLGLLLATPCYRGEIVVPSVESTTISGLGCGRTDTLGLIAAGTLGNTYLARATSVAGAPARFDTWHGIQPIAVTTHVHSELPGGAVQVLTMAELAPDFRYWLREGLPVGLPGVVKVAIDGGGSYTRRFEAPPPALTVEATDFLAPLQPPVAYGDAQGLAVRLTDTGRAFDDCRVMFQAESPSFMLWTIHTGPIADANHVVRVPALPDGRAMRVISGVEVTCIENQGLADPTRPERTAVGASRR